MELKEYVGLAERETSYFWNVGRREILHEALSRHLSHRQNNTILDVGCGTGGNMLLLNNFGAITGVDFSSEALRLATSKGYKQLLQADAEKLPFGNNSFDLITALDVLEHVPGDTQALAEVWRVLRPGGVFVLTVPSYQWLWSQHDVALHHKRRYAKKNLLELVKKSSFVVKQSSHFVALGVPMNFLRKCLDKLFPARVKNAAVYDVVFAPWLNSLLLAELRLEKVLLRYLSLPFGTSVMVVAQKPGL